MLIGRAAASRQVVALLLGIVLLGCAKADENRGQAQLTVRAASGALSQADQRTALVVDDETRVAVLTEMRTMLKAVQGIVAAAANADTAGIRSAALRGGMKAASENNPIVAQQLGGDFVQLGMRTHASFDILAADVARGNEDVMLRRLAVIMGNCVGCHEKWRLTLQQ
jgi:hypothetical protein